MPVLLEIDFKGTNQFFFLSSDDSSAYPLEQEVLLQEGIKYKVIGIEEDDFTRNINGERC